MFRASLLLIPIALLCRASAAGASDQTSRFSATATLGVSSDYVFRGLSLRGGRPSPLAMLDLEYGSYYAGLAVIAEDLGEDLNGRSIGNCELDIRFGMTREIGAISLDFGVQAYTYPNGRDTIFDTLEHAERDFFEAYASAETEVIPGLINATGRVFWSPNFYYETGDVWTFEGQSAVTLPTVGPFAPRLTAAVGRVVSEQAGAASPGHGYLYYNAGLELRVDRLILDVRYWGTDIENMTDFDERLVLTTGVALPILPFAPIQ